MSMPRGEGKKNASSAAGIKDAGCDADLLGGGVGALSRTLLRPRGLLVLSSTTYPPMNSSALFSSGGGLERQREGR